ncbi:MAG: hypothetical protein JKX85_15680 [Phycisphaeraceae bacterium]|nr:hypothetical protein [Phycisphaeraceae bacterium]
MTLFEAFDVTGMGVGLEAVRAPRQTAPERPSILQPIADAVRAEWIGSFALQQMGREDFEPDQNFVFTGELIKELTQGIPDDMHYAYDTARSLKEAKHIRGNLLKSLAAQRRLAQLGWTGIGLRLGAAILDPVAIAATVATEGMAGPAVYGAKLTRVQRLVRGGLVAAGTNVAIESYLVSQDPTRDGTDIIYAATAGLIMGGAGAVLFPQAKIADIAKSLHKEIDLVNALDEGLEITPAGKMYWRDNLSREVQNERLRGLTSHLDLADDQINEIHSSIGAFKEPNIDKVTGEVMPRSDFNQATQDLGEALDVEIATLDISKVTEAKSTQVKLFGIPLRFGMSYKLGQSKVPMVRKMASLMAEDTLEKADGSPSLFTVSEWIASSLRKTMSQVADTRNKAFADYKKAKGIPFMKSQRASEEFGEEIGIALRHGPGKYTNDPHINMVADLHREKYHQLLKLAKKYNVDGFENIIESQTYIPRMASMAKIDNLRKAIGQKKLHLMVKNSLLSGSVEMDEDVADKLATKWFGHVDKRFWEMDGRTARMYSSETSENIVDGLAKEFPDLDVEDIRYMVGQMGTPDGVVSPRAKRRMSIDESFKMDVLTKDGKTISLGISDLLENNADVIFERYSSHIFSSAGSRQILEAMAEPGEKAAQNFKTLVTRIENSGQENLTIRERNSLKSDVKKLKTIWKTINGIPVDDTDPIVREVLQSIRSVNFIRSMNRVGFAQIAEIGNATGEAGWRAMAQQMPGLREIVDLALTGKMPNELFKELNSIWAIGTDRMRQVATSRLEDYALSSIYGTSRIGKLLDKGRKITADISLFHIIDGPLRNVAHAAGLQKFVNEAFTNRIPSAKRLAQIGLTKDEFSIIAEQIRKHAKTTKGLLGEKLRLINFEQWDNQDAVANLITGMDKWSRQVVQENNIGQMSNWMTGSLGRTLIQFRAFTVVAWEKQLARGLHNMDQQTFNAFMLSTLFGGLGYVSLTYATSIGRPDREEYLAKRLSLAEIGKGSFQRAGFSSLMPGLIDSAIKVTGNDPLFQFGRTTGLATNFATGNPTVDLLSRMEQAARGVIAPSINSDYQFSQQDARAIKGVLPFNNAIGIGNILDAAGGGLPKTSK